MLLNKDILLNILKNLKLDNACDLADPNVLKELIVGANKVDVNICVSNPTLQFKNKIKAEIKKEVLKKYPDVIINIDFIVEKSIKNIIAIASGKGGVGKSTISSNLAIALKNEGYQVGLVDADIYGPSIPLMFDSENEKPKAVQDKNGKNGLMSPVISYGVKIMSIGFFSNRNDAIVWRGPMATKALNHIINQTDWGSLDYLLIDLPPGTGDIHLTLVQTASITGVIIVTTPQPVALIDAKKAIHMFKMKQINIPIIGLVENMSCLLIENKKHYIFGKDGGKILSESEDVPLLKEIPLNQTIREAGDIGRPAALQKTELGDLFLDLARKVDVSVNRRNKNLSPTKKVKITHNRGCN